MPPYRDSSGRTLAEYPHPNTAVDTAVLTVSRDFTLCVGLVDDGGLRLPGTFLHERERLADAVRRSLQAKAGIEGLQPEQLHVFDDPNRDERGWVLSVAHVDVVPADRLASSDKLRVVPMAEARDLPFDHDEIVARAVAWLRARYEKEPDPAHLLPDRFTLRDLQRVHEAVAGTTFQRDTFRRGMLRTERIKETGERLSGIVGKPPRLFERVEPRP
jgi:8-oxo-dGTP diphosphatase